MFNVQKALAQELLIKLQKQPQPFASNFVFNALLGEFSNIETFPSHMNPSY